MPSVPGLDGKMSLEDWINRHHYLMSGPVHAVHRLDMDTSGVMIFAKDERAAVNLRRQFEEHTIEKTYLARLSPSGRQALHAGEKGTIHIPLNADYDERPRQKSDSINGKEAMTHYEVLSLNPDGTTDI
jgi:tRNA pseudouridine32 synthase/23S rRNA pseudouridine746 synthase